jgi:hypothetical protein
VTEESSEPVDGIELLALRAVVEDLTQRLGEAESPAAERLTDLLGVEIFADLNAQGWPRGWPTRKPDETGRRVT